MQNERSVDRIKEKMLGGKFTMFEINPNQ